MEQKLEKYFPEINSGIIPLDGQVVLQVIHVPETTSSGNIIISAQAQDEKQYAVKVSKVVKVGPNAFKNKLTGAAWSSVALEVGDYVVAPQVSGTRFTKKINPADRNSIEVHFIACKDTEIQFKVEDPLSFNSVY